MSCESRDTSDGQETDATATVDALKSWVRAFSQARDWEQFHNPKDLALALVCEVGELLEHFRYRTDREVAAHLEVTQNQVELSHELADCLWLLLRLADVCAVDLARSLREKLVIADRKYPVEQAFGRPDKYTAYQAKMDRPDGETEGR
jgi:dCTP diphosphatase